MRKLLIERYKHIINNKDVCIYLYYNWWDMKYKSKQCPDFTKMSDEKLLEEFVELIKCSTASDYSQ